jgi:hypothetical protein
MEGGSLMVVSLSEVFVLNQRQSETQGAEDSAPPRLYVFMDPKSRLIVGAVVSTSIPDEQTIASLLPERSDSLLESEDMQRNQ